MYDKSFEGAVHVWTPRGNFELAGFGEEAQRPYVAALNEAARAEGGHVQWFHNGLVETGSVEEPGLSGQ